MLATVREAVAVESVSLFSPALLDSVLCRYLGDSAESARRYFTDAWRAVRSGPGSAAAADLADMRRPAAWESEAREW